MQCSSKPVITLHNKLVIWSHRTSLVKPYEGTLSANHPSMGKKGEEFI